MYTCNYCDFIFEEKKSLTIHQKTKKCIVHRDIGFVCQKCFKDIKGYDNTLKHVSECKENIDSDLGLLTSIINQLSTRFEINLNLENDNNNGTISFKKLNNYNHPKKLDDGASIPQKTYLFQKVLNKCNDEQILGSHNHYLNDVFSKIARLDESFRLLSVKYGFEDLLKIVWLQTDMSCFQLKDGNIYVLGKVQCQNNDGQKWFGDTFNLKNDEKIIKCIWYKDPQLKQFYSCLKPLLKDILNLYFELGGWVLKQKKIKFKESTDLESKYKIINDLMVEYNFTNLINNVKKLDSYDIFFQTFEPMLIKMVNKNHMLYSNIVHVFKDELLPSIMIDEEYSLMTMNNPKFMNGNYYYLMDYILSDAEKIIFRSKE